jgi:hypothetical protein
LLFRCIEGPAVQPALCFDYFQRDAFIAHSQNKPDGTEDIGEHRTPAAVVGAGNANT